MNKILLAAATISVTFLIYTLTPSSTEISIPYSQESNVNNGKEIYLNYCAQCHGTNLEGQENWRKRDKFGYLPAPPHDETGHTWHHSDETLFKLTKFGVSWVAGEDYLSRMPAYKDILSDKEILDVLAYIKAEWPPKVRAEHSKLK